MNSPAIDGTSTDADADADADADDRTSTIGGALP